MFHNPLPTNRPIAAPSCSIPSRFQTYVVDTADKKGFNSGTRRFNPLELVGPDTPGPGHYFDFSKILETFVSESISSI